MVKSHEMWYYFIDYGQIKNAMENKIQLSKLIQYIVIGIAILIFLMIWPTGLIKRQVTLTSKENIACESGPVSVASHIDQMFTATEGELKSVDLYVCNDMAGQVITFRLYDASHGQIFETFYTVDSDFTAPGFVHIPVRYDMTASDAFFIIEGLDTDLYVALEDRADADTVNYFMTYGDEECFDKDVVIRYNYACDFALWQLLLIALGLVLAAALLCFGARRLPDREVNSLHFVRCVCNPLLAIAMLLICYIVMIKRVFGINTKNNAVICLGFLLILALPAYMINSKKFAININWLKKLSVRNILQTITLATMLWYCYEYMNGLYNIYHYYSISKIVIVFFCFLITTFDKKEILNIPNLIWLIAGPVLGYLYYRPMAGEPENGELYRLNGWVIALGGFIVINLFYVILRLIKKQLVLKKVNPYFVIPFMVFAIGICVLANTRYWPGLLVGICLLTMVRLIVAPDNADLRKNLCLAIVLNFYMMVFYSLRHRPYYFYQFYRYNMGYHTVTVTAYYLAMVLCGAWVRLCDRYKEHKHIYDLIPSLFTFGMAGVYLIFTMSRTGFLSAFGMLVCALILSALIYTAKSKRGRSTLRLAFIMLAAVIYMFPVTYGLTDVVPRLANDPIAFEYEVRDFTFTQGMPLEDPSYMTIQQFFHMFGQKVFGLSDKDEARLIEELHPLTLTAYAADGESESEDDEEDVTDMSNGRFDIFRAYLSNMNLWGHDDMGCELPDGEIAVHAHNTFIQVMYDHGIIFGIYFALFIGYVIVYSVVEAFRHKDNVYYALCPLLVICFSMASMVEWILHPANPFGLAIFLAMMPMCIRDRVNEKNI